GHFEHLVVEQLHRHARLENVVDACRPAAEVGMGHLDKVEPRNGAQDRTRRFTYPLCMSQVTGILVGDAGIDRSKVMLEAQSGDELGYVLDQRVEEAPL